jgi:hypothetical protein
MKIAGDEMFGAFQLIGADPFHGIHQVHRICKLSCTRCQLMLPLLRSAKAHQLLVEGSPHSFPKPEWHVVIDEAAG